MLVLLLKHISIKNLKHIIKALFYISTYPTLAVIAKYVPSVLASSAPVEQSSVLLVKILGLITVE